MLLARSFSNRIGSNSGLKRYLKSSNYLYQSSILCQSHLSLLQTRHSSSSSTSSSIKDTNSKPSKSSVLPLSLPSNETNPNLIKIRHSAAHIMAMAVQKLFPHIQVTIGPWTEFGYFYDFYNPEKNFFTPENLVDIKAEMNSIIKQNLPITREEVSREEARKRIQAINEPFKLEILDSIKTEPITIYHIGNKWWDLCAGPHVNSTGELSADAIELENVSSSYWKNDSSQPSLLRISAVAWETAEQLKQYKEMMEEISKRDHRTIGKKLDLFSIQEQAGGGLVFWHPKGAQIRKMIEDYWVKMHTESGYELLYTPHIANIDLWKTSGHLDFYSENMFESMEVESSTMQLKPMNCPFHCLIYNNTSRSYRELPIRWAELGTVYRYELSGTLHGLMRVRGFTQDDAHIFCLPEQLEDEIIGVLNLTETILKKFGFEEFKVMLSTRPQKSVGSDEIWEIATNALRDALKRKGWDYTIDEGGGAFYGPKIDVKIKDAIGRLWQCSTIQCDFNLPERFNLQYTASDASKKRPIMVHRAIFGSLERFFGTLIEHCSGNFPFWISPTQTRFLCVTKDSYETCANLAKEAKKYGIRAEVDNGTNKLGKQIRNAEVDHIPVMIIVGIKEMEKGVVTVRTRSKGEMGSIEPSRLFELMKLASEKSLELHEVWDYQSNTTTTTTTTNLEENQNQNQNQNCCSSTKKVGL